MDAFDTTETKQFWDGIDRLPRPYQKERFFELSIESSWRPTDLHLEATEGSLRALGLVPERRR